VHVEVVGGFLGTQVLFAEQEERDREAEDDEEAAETGENPAKLEGLVPAAVSLHVSGQDTICRELIFCLTL
jgi:hypothetical protein